MGLKLQPCFSPMLDLKGFVMPFRKHTLSWTLQYYIFSRRVINFSVTSYEYNLSNNPSLQILLQAFLKPAKQR